jgi:hypothetical protein
MVLLHYNINILVAYVHLTYQILAHIVEPGYARKHMISQISHVYAVKVRFHTRSVAPPGVNFWTKPGCQ